MSQQSYRASQSVRPAVLRLDSGEVRGMLSGVIERGERVSLAQVLTFVPETYDAGVPAGDGGAAIATWASPGCRYEVVVQVGARDEGEPLALEPQSAAIRRQDRRASRIAIELDCRVWWSSPIGVESLTTTTVDLSATGMAVRMPHPRSADGLGIPAPGDQLAVTLQLPDRRIACIAEVVAHSSSVGRHVLRMRLHRCRKSDTTFLARFVILTEARRP